MIEDGNKIPPSFYLRKSEPLSWKRSHDPKFADFGGVFQPDFPEHRCKMVQGKGAIFPYFNADIDSTRESIS